MRRVGPAPRAALLALGLGVAALLAACGDGEERRIRRALAEIRGLAAKAPGESELAGLATARKIALHFTDPVSVTAEPVGLATRDRRGLIGAIHQYRSRTDALYVRTYDEELELDPAGGRARMTLTVEFVRELADLAGAERYAVVLYWVRGDGEWLVEAAEVRRSG
ncbi:MAG: hypothetical protein R3325_04595 [Thermoanaerobaculia bacterium]|nr:hypothetical protein [Thermoanaerobaculia bacterium]